MIQATLIGTFTRKRSFAAGSLASSHGWQCLAALAVPARTPSGGRTVNSNNCLKLLPKKRGVAR